MTCGIIIAKKNSKRFPGKNTHIYNGKPLYKHNYDLLSSLFDTYLCTNIPFLKEENIIYRGVNLSTDEQPLFELIKFGYQSMPIAYEWIVCILANTINVDKKDVLKGLEIAKKNNLKEVRSYGKNGVENGLLILHKTVINEPRISTYVGMIETDSKEIHYKNDLYC